jgi:hypothetical protein
MLKLTLRDLFWLVLVVAMGVGWWIDRSRLQREAVDSFRQGRVYEATQVPRVDIGGTPSVSH